ncbi:hypothetical protein KUV80_13395 [Fictibacillus nanhaiensis]|uniref:hypothetical protein n=1 Tax=Fictibacillus nanhaiensis TaxID=742169 RepID=UPI001C960DF5|nr:hypothetical protein [Fictibacillus nanhaiensis]MBY6037659.1 hypothetical protein [Fictibacillus nanhaiensis]
MKTLRYGSVKGYKDMKVPFAILGKSETPLGLVIMLPGVGYTVHAPLFHFATSGYINKGYDVLHVNYQYYIEAYDECTNEELRSALVHDVHAVLENTLCDVHYGSYYLVGKSFVCFTKCEIGVADSTN